MNKKSARGFGAIAVSVIILIVLVISGGAIAGFLILKNATTQEAKTSKTTDHETNFPIGDTSRVAVNSDILPANKQYLTENELRLTIPKNLISVPTTQAPGQLFATSADGKASFVIAVFGTSQECFKTFDEFKSAIKNQVGNNVTLTQEKEINGIPTYRADVLIDNKSGDPLQLINMLYKGQTSNYQVSVGVKKEFLQNQDLANSVINSAKLLTTTLEADRNPCKTNG